MSAPGRVVFGRIGRAQGLGGEVRLFPGNPDSDLLRRFANVAVTVQLEDRTLETRVVQCRPGKDRAWNLKLAGIPDRTAAESWTHADLLVDPSLFGSADEGEFFAWQLEGLKMMTAAGETVGTVQGLDNFGAGDLLRVRYRGRDEFVPFAAPWVGDIDLEARTVIVALDDLFGDDG